MRRWLCRAWPGLPQPAGLLLLAVSVSLLLPLSRSCGLVQYRPHDRVKVLDASTLKGFIFYSRSAWVVQFFAHWCIDSVVLAPTWRALAEDIKDWRPTVQLGVIDCGDKANEEICTYFEIEDYPTVKFFKPFSKYPGESIEINATALNSQSLKERIITLVANHEKAFWSHDTPTLTPLSASDAFQFQENNVALIFEDAASFFGSEVILDMAQFENITLRRVLKGDEKLASACDVTAYPSLFQLHNKDSCELILSDNSSTSHYAGLLQQLPGVYRKNNYIDPPSREPEINHTFWKVANRSKVYLADLESSVMCSLRRVELQFLYLDEEPLTALKKYLNLLTEYFPENSIAKADLQNLSDWLTVRTNVSRNDWTEALKPIKEALHGNQSDTRIWVRCQKSSPLFRGYPCSVWILFHFLTVQEGLPNNKEITQSKSLSAMREFMKNFFGCPKCSKHFEDMARESMDEVKTTDEAILWLWRKHNAVNLRLKDGSTSDPEFSKIQWPPHDLCELCSKSNGEFAWDNLAVLNFLKNHFSMANIALDGPS